MDPGNREPTEVETKRIGEAIERSAHRQRPVKATIKKAKLAAPHSDQAGHLIMLLEALGTGSIEFGLENLAALEMVTRERGIDRALRAAPLNAGFALVQAVAPENELEAALAIQMAGTHALATELLGKAKQTEMTDHLQLYGNLAVKLQRTFAAQIEALARLRGKGQQTVRVEHVTVQPGAQAIVGDVHHYRPGRGAGVRLETGVQCDDQADQRPADASVAALSRPDPVRDRVSVPRGPRKAKVPATRGHQPRRPKR